MSLYVIGAGGHAKVVVSTLRAMGKEPDGFLDDDPTLADKEVLGLKVLGQIAKFSGQNHEAIVAIGSNAARKRIVSETSFRWISAIHPHSWRDSTVSIGEGSVVFAGVVIQPDTVIGRHAILNTSCSLDHECIVSDYCHIAPGCHLAGAVRVDEGGFLGIGSAIIPGISIGAWSLVGAGSTVIRNVEGGSKVVGCPAKPIV